MVPCPIHSQGLSRNRISFIGSKKFLCLTKKTDRDFMASSPYLLLSTTVLMTRICSRDHPPCRVQLSWGKAQVPEFIKPGTWARAIITTAQCFLDTSPKSSKRGLRVLLLREERSKKGS